MISGIFHQGSGLGNQLHRYEATRVLAFDKGYEWGMIGNFKGDFFKEQRKVSIALPKMWKEKKVLDNGVDIRSYDPEFDFIEDETLIDGEFQDERYFGHRLHEIDEWLKVEPLEINDDVCVIGFRGGEYVGVSDLFLSKEYWDSAMKEMLRINHKAFFDVHTDDPETAKLFFPDFPVTHNVGLNWRSMRYAKYAIIANSSFYILPRLLRQNIDKTAVTIAPRYWGRRNIGVWSMAQNYYKEFTHL